MSVRVRSRCGKRAVSTSKAVYRPDGSVSVRHRINGRIVLPADAPPGTLTEPPTVETIEHGAYGETVHPRITHTIWLRGTERQLRRFLYHWRKRGVRLNPLIRNGVPLVDRGDAVYRVDGPAEQLNVMRFDARIIRYEEGKVARCGLGTGKLTRQRK